MSAIALAGPRAAARVGLWVFMGVVGTLFFLFSLAFLMRMAMDDWQGLPFVPWQLWLSTALLAASGGAWERARRAARPRAACLLACACALGFLGAQLWAWSAMRALHVTVDGGPASSFFYLITGLHGLHVAGGLVAGALVLAGRASIELCARYWHFLLLLWLAMFALLFLVTPDLVQQVCSVF
ncbi:MAG: bb3-type cytochrome oxidase subunit III [Pseudomonadota bacterium]